MRDAEDAASERSSTGGIGSALTRIASGQFAYGTLELFNLVLGQALEDLQMTTAAPRCSIIMSAYNVANHLARSIASVKKQDFTDWEMIIVDDNSSDATLAVARAAADADSRIRVIAQETNQGPSAARNRALDAARGDFIAVLDADDAWTDERLSCLLNIADSERADVVLDNLLFYDDAKSVITGTAFPAGDTLRAIGLGEIIESERPGKRFRYGFLKPVIRRSFLELHAIRYNNKIRLAEDFLLLCECSIRESKAFITHNPGYIYTTQVGALSGISSSGTRTLVRMADPVVVAGVLIKISKIVQNTHYLELSKMYRKWMVQNWAITEISRLKKASPLKAFLVALAHPAASLRYVRTSSTFERIFGG